MTTLREAAQMALDALEHGLPIIEDFGGKEQLQLQHKAIAVLYEALRAALAQPEQEPTRSQKMRDAGITRRPKGWDKEQELEGINEVILNSIRDSSEVVAPPQREWQGLTDEERKEIIRKQKDFWGPVGWELECAKAIEAKLKEKNSG